MTIAACYLSAEGVVFGSDSTSTMFVKGPGADGAYHHYDYAQKIFQVGEDSSLAITMWGMGSLAERSHRTLVAQFADFLASKGAQTLAEVADLWSRFFWDAYSLEWRQHLDRVQQLNLNQARTPEEEDELEGLQQNLSGGFCLGGHLLNDRLPGAFEILYSPEQTDASPPTAMRIGSSRFWGCPNLISRLMYGIDPGVPEAIFQSGKWNGSAKELTDLVRPYFLGQPSNLPIRDAIDWVHASVYTTIKTMKFSHMAPVCGGPVEVAVITTDRKFRWVRHKRFDAAFEEGGLL